MKLTKEHQTELAAEVYKELFPDADEIYIELYGQKKYKGRITPVDNSVDKKK